MQCTALFVSIIPRMITMEGEILLLQVVDRIDLEGKFDDSSAKCQRNHTHIGKHIRSRIHNTSETNILTIQITEQSSTALYFVIMLLNDLLDWYRLIQLNAKFAKQVTSTATSDVNVNKIALIIHMEWNASKSDWMQWMPIIRIIWNQTAFVHTHYTTQLCQSVRINYGYFINLLSFDLYYSISWMLNRTNWFWS